MDVRAEKIFKEFGVPKTDNNGKMIRIQDNLWSMEREGRFMKLKKSWMSLNGTSSVTLGKGIPNDSGFRSLTDIDVTSFQGAQDSLAVIDKSINEVSTTRATLDVFQKNTLESNLSSLRVASENLINAESILRDTDMAEEMANLTKQQIMASSGMAMLA